MQPAVNLLPPKVFDNDDAASPARPATPLAAPAAPLHKSNAETRHCAFPIVERASEWAASL